MLPFLNVFPLKRLFDFEGVNLKAHLESQPCFLDYVSVICKRKAPFLEGLAVGQESMLLLWGGTT